MGRDQGGPQNGYGQVNGQSIFSHGVEFGLAKAGSRDLHEATNALLKAVAQNNPELRLAGEQQAMKMSQRSAIATPLVNPSPLGGQEHIVFDTTFLSDGSRSAIACRRATLFYYPTIAPESEAQFYQETCRRIGESIRLTEAR